MLFVHYFVVNKDEYIYTLYNKYNIRRNHDESVQKYERTAYTMIFKSAPIYF